MSESVTINVVGCKLTKYCLGPTIAYKFGNLPTEFQDVFSVLFDVEPNADTLVTVNLEQCSE